MNGPGEPDPEASAPAPSESLPLHELRSKAYPKGGVHRSALRWLGCVAISAIAGAVVLAFCGQSMAASSLVAVATAAVAGMVAIFK